MHDIGGKTGLYLLLLLLIVEFPALIFSYLVIDNPEYGRKKISIMTTLGQFIVLATLFFGKESTIIIGLMLVFFLKRIINVTIITIVVESYNTIYRSRGLGMAYLMGNLFELKKEIL